MEMGKADASMMAWIVSAGESTCPSATMRQKVNSRGVVRLTSSIVLRIAGAKDVGPASVTVGMRAEYAASTPGSPSQKTSGSMRASSTDQPPALWKAKTECASHERSPKP